MLGMLVQYLKPATGNRVIALFCLAKGKLSWHPWLVDDTYYPVCLAGSVKIRCLLSSFSAARLPLVRKLPQNLRHHLPRHEMTLTLGVLKKQNAETSAAVINLFEDDDSFKRLAKYEGDLTVSRDKEDAEKLQKGIDFAKEKGVIDPDFKPEPYVPIDVLGKSPDQVADAILEKFGDGKILVLVGLSGTGKGTTVAKLRQKLEASGKSVVTWSNGNIFRSVTLLAATWCEQNCGAFDKEKALTKENIAAFMKMLKFGKNAEGQFDTHIDGLGLDLWISHVQNTELKTPKVSKNIPTVAEFTQVSYPSHF